MKRFKEYDQIFKGKTHALVKATTDSELDAAERSIDRWVLPVTAWDRDTVAYCVYENEDHADWQQFRVSLKGMTTAQKLYMLRVYRGHMYNVKAGTIWCDRMRWTSVIDCRVDNYIGALRRGGQLDENNIIVKGR